MKDLNYQLSEMCRDNRDGSFSTQATRSRLLDLIASQLLEIGFRRMQPRSLKPLRWWAKKINKPSIIAKENSVYGIGKRAYVAKISKAQELDEKKLSSLSDKYVRLSVRLQAAFGLRREESIKFSPNYAVQGNHIKLKSSWTKGGRARTVPITNEGQRRLLEEVKALARGGALIPPHLNYVQQLHRYEKHTAKAGLSQPHGLRHGYAQRRYFELTERVCPVAGGLPSKDLNPAQRALDHEARAIISSELGHAREAISAVYLGR